MKVNPQFSVCDRMKLLTLWTLTLCPISICNFLPEAWPQTISKYLHQLGPLAVSHQYVHYLRLGKALVCGHPSFENSKKD